MLTLCVPDPLIHGVKYTPFLQSIRNYVRFLSILLIQYLEARLRNYHQYENAKVSYPSASTLVRHFSRIKG